MVCDPLPLSQTNFLALTNRGTEKNKNKDSQDISPPLVTANELAIAPPIYGRIFIWISAHHSPPPATPKTTPSFAHSMNPQIALLQALSKSPFCSVSAFSTSP